MATQPVRYMALRMLRVPVLCRNYGQTPWGNPKTGAFRAKFVRESVHNLKENLKAIGSDLAIALDRPERVIAGAPTCCCVSTACLTIVWPADKVPGPDLPPCLSCRADAKRWQAHSHRWHGIYLRGAHHRATCELRFVRMLD